MPLLPGASGHRGGALFLCLLLTSFGVSTGAHLRYCEQWLIGGAQVGDDVGMFLLFMSQKRPTELPMAFPGADTYLAYTCEFSAVIFHH